jgi:hypothetical protein
MYLNKEGKARMRDGAETDNPGTKAGKAFSRSTLWLVLIFGLEYNNAKKSSDSDGGADPITGYVRKTRNGGKVFDTCSMTYYVGTGQTISRSKVSEVLSVN